MSRTQQIDLDYSAEALLSLDIPPLASARMHRLPPYLFGRINTLKAALRHKGVDIIDLGMGNPNDPTPQAIVDKLRQAAGITRNQRYSASQGVFNLRREAAQFYEKLWGVQLDPKHEVIATIGTKEGISHLCLATLGPGDVALRICEMCRTVSPRPKIVMLNYPHNPTARTVELGFFEEVVRLAKRFHYYVIHDFAYGLTTFDGYQAPSFLQAPGAKDVGVESLTMSKGYNMAGWRIGFMMGNPDMVKLLGAIKGYYDYGIFQAIQIATVIALRHCDEDMRAQAMIYQQRRDILCEGLTRAGWQVEKPKATMFVWAKIPEPYSQMGSIEFAIQSLKKAEVAVAPGRGFGEDGEGYVRIALGENDERLRQAVRQLRRAFPVEG
jgi:alanine-synthesizing transaminase